MKLHSSSISRTSPSRAGKSVWAKASWGHRCSCNCSCNSRSFFEPRVQSRARHLEDATDAAHRGPLLIRPQDHLLLLGRVTLVLRRLAAAPPARLAFVALLARPRTSVANHVLAPTVTTRNQRRNHASNLTHHPTLCHYRKDGLKPALQTFMLPPFQTASQGFGFRSCLFRHSLWLSPFCALVVADKRKARAWGATWVHL